MSREYILSADGIKAALADRIGAAVVFRINYPKNLAGKVTRNASLSAKVRPLLTEQESQDVKQTVALVLVATGALEKGRIGLAVWKECFRAARGADCLRIDRQAKNKSEIVKIESLSPEEAEMLGIRESLPGIPLARRNVIARRARYARAQILAAFGADKSRKRKSNLLFAKRFLRFLISNYSEIGWGVGEVTKGNDSSSLRHAHKTFADYLAKGEEILTRESLAEVSGPIVRELRSFEQIPQNFAIAE